MFSGFDHPVVDWLEQRRIERQLRKRRARELATSTENRRLERLEISMVEALPDVARESIERASVHLRNEIAPHRDDDARRR